MKTLRILRIPIENHLLSDLKRLMNIVGVKVANNFRLGKISSHYLFYTEPKTSVAVQMTDLKNKF